MDVTKNFKTTNFVFISIAKTISFPKFILHLTIFETKNLKDNLMCET